MDVKSFDTTCLMKSFEGVEFRLKKIRLQREALKKQFYTFFFILKSQRQSFKIEIEEEDLFLQQEHVTFISNGFSNPQFYR